MVTQVSLHEGLFADFLTRLELLQYSPYTIRRYRGSVQRLIRRYPAVPFEVLTPEHIERHLFARSVSARSKATELEELRAFFKYLIRQKVLKTNPCQGAETPRWQERFRPAPSWDDFLAICRACQSAEETLLVELVYFTGLRHEEFRRLRIRQVDVQRRRIRVIGKGSKERWVFFPQPVADLLQQTFAGRRPDDPVFFYRTGLRSTKWIDKTLARLGEQAGLPYRLIPHILRHGFARLCKTREIPLEVAAKLMGHNSIHTTARIYGRLDTDDLQASYDRHIQSSC